ncbi:MAG: bacitracin ABC transporter ATP-binding protein [Bacillaceae bacterium]|jgi:ABC-2 type transport system ATP-binding protein|nr:bacitracin ABC transporter ATP-binding protein [Bacillaceae bacterium]
MKPVVELKNVTKIIGGKKIIDSISFSVYEGEVFGLLGPNGAGKTTTMRLMTGLMRITSGEILINGESIASDFENAVRQIGAIVENPEMYKFLTGYENLKQAARLAKGVTKERMDEIIDLVGLTPRIHDKVKNYSLGMRQRLGIALCLLHDPKILILDEPTNGLDPAGIREIRNYLRSLAREKNLAVIVSSHLLSEVELMCDRVAIMQKGRLIDVQKVHGEGDAERQTYRFTVNDADRAANILKSKGIEAAADGQKLEAALAKQQVPDVIKWLVEENLLIYEVKPLRKTLEDRFLEITAAKEAAVNG